MAVTIVTAFRSPHSAVRFGKMDGTVIVRSDRRALMDKRDGARSRLAPWLLAVFGVVGVVAIAVSTISVGAAQRR